MLVASIYDNAFFQQFARRLKASAKFFGIDCELFKRTQSSGPRSKARFRSEFILTRLTELRHPDLLLVDPDAVFTQRPAILLDERDFDLAVYYDQKTLAVSGPIFVRNNPRIRRWVQEWHLLSNALPERSEYEALSTLLSQPKVSLSVRRLPVTYAWVERVDRERHPSAQPVITHFQADSISTRVRLTV
jgi:hypothetical protein